jgi:two-component system, response regulator YesN
VYYKVFLVEDEIAAREGIRDNVDWRAAGFEFCGEAPDGEIALPLIEAAQPDVLITDIKMPFMDGLQLARIVREHLPWVKVVILSGYDEFGYAQAAVKLGVTEYLLKPISVPDLNAVLRKIKTVLDQEKSDREYLKLLRSQVEDNLILLREKFLLRLVLGGESSISAIEQSEQLGLEIIAKCYLVLLVKINFAAGAQPFDFAACQEIEKIIAGLVSANMDALLTRKDMEELVLILKGQDPGEVEEEAQFLADLIRKEVEGKTACSLTIAAGSPHQRLGDLHRSFAEALVKVQDAREDFENGELQKLDQPALMRFLESGRAGDFDSFFESYIRPLGETALRSRLLKYYIMVDIILTVAQFVSDLGGNVDQMVPEIHHGDIVVATVRSLEQIKAETLRLITAAHVFRDNQVNNDRAVVIRQAKTYIHAHFTDPALSLNEVAAQVSFSPNHFSAVFSDESGETFRDYLIKTRVTQARKLLRTTGLKISEVAYQCGYNDPHYFSIIFRKHTGLTPQQFREAPMKKSSSA